MGSILHKHLKLRSCDIKQSRQHLWTVWHRVDDIVDWHLETTKVRQLSHVYMDLQSDSIFTLLALRFLGNNGLPVWLVQPPFATCPTSCVVPPSAVWSVTMPPQNLNQNQMRTRSNKSVFNTSARTARNITLHKLILTQVSQKTESGDCFVETVMKTNFF